MLPVEWTEKREPGVVVPIPTFPFPAIYKLLADDPLLTTKAALLPMVSPPVMVEVLWEAEKLMVKAEVEALVAVRLVTVPVVDQKVGNVA